MPFPFRSRTHKWHTYTQSHKSHWSNFKAGTAKGRVWQYTSSCQISLTSVKRFRRYFKFSTSKISAIRRNGVLKVNFYGKWNPEGTSIQNFIEICSPSNVRADITIFDFPHCVVCHVGFLKCPSGQPQSILVIVMPCKLVFCAFGLTTPIYSSHKIVFWVISENGFARDATRWRGKFCIQNLRIPRGCYEYATRKLLPWNLGHSEVRFCGLTLKFLGEIQPANLHGYTS